MMESSYCTYRVSRGGHKSAGNCILCKHEMHCQHFRKPIQLQRAAVANAKKGKKSACIQVRERKTKCPSHLTISLQVPTKKQKLSAEHPYLLSHRAVLNINFIHNHPIHAAHTLSFSPLSENTKQQIFELFDKGHCAASARHTHEQMLILNSDTNVEKQTLLADRASNPNVQDICRLFVEW